MMRIPATRGYHVRTERRLTIRIERPIIRPQLAASHALLARVLPYHVFCLLDFHRSTPSVVWRSQQMPEGRSIGRWYWSIPWDDHACSASVQTRALHSSVLFDLLR